ncbi:hypothetical protein ABU952_05925 [Bacillus amyloliquefaciens]
MLAILGCGLDVMHDDSGFKKGNILPQNECRTETLAAQLKYM